MKGIYYRIYTEQRANLSRLTRAYFDGFTIFSGLGAFRGLTETADIIEIFTDDSVESRAKVYDLAEVIRIENKQTSVIVSEMPADIVQFAEDIT